MSAKVSKASVNYRQAAPRAEKRCGNCSMYRAGRCTLVVGPITPNSVCNRWERKK